MTASFRFSKTRQNGPFLSTQNVNVARFARNVEWDFFCDFQTLCTIWSNLRLLKAEGFLLGRLASSMFCVSDGNHTLLWPQCTHFEYVYSSSVHSLLLLLSRFLSLRLLWPLDFCQGLELCIHDLLPSKHWRPYNATVMSKTQISWHKTLHNLEEML